VPKLKTGELASYVVVDDAGNDQQQIGLVLEVFTLDGSDHARVAPLTASLVVGVDALTAID